MGHLSEMPFQRISEGAATPSADFSVYAVGAVSSQCCSFTIVCEQARVVPDVPERPLTEVSFREGLREAHAPPDAAVTGDAESIKPRLTSCPEARLCLAPSEERLFGMEVSDIVGKVEMKLSFSLFFDGPLVEIQNGLLRNGAILIRCIPQGIRELKLPSIHGP